MTPEQQLQSALSHHRAGRLKEAEEIYRQVLVAQPENSDALYLLGTIASQLGRAEESIELIQQAIRIKPANADYHNNLGVILTSARQTEAAIDAYRKAIALKPNYPEALYNLGIALVELNRTEEAVDAFRRSNSHKPNAAGTLNALSLALRKLGKFEEAVDFSRQVLKLHPENREFQYNLCMVLIETGRKTEALEVCRKTIDLDPRDAGAISNAGNILRDLGRLEEAISSYRQAIALMPQYAEAHSNLANVLADSKRFDEAIASYRQAIQLKPDYAEAHSNLASALKNKGRFDEAIAEFRQAIRLKPDLAETHASLGNALKEIGKLDPAIDEFRAALRLKPDYPVAHSDLILALLYHSASDTTIIRDELRAWNRQHAEPLQKLIQPHSNDRDPCRRLRIGYVSPDFRDHVVGRNLLPLFQGHDHSQVEIFCYANVVFPDALTEKFRASSDVWRSIVGLSDSKAADLIRHDRIDILVDLALHTGGNRLLIFARKPAPVQATFAGYPGSTGLKAIDYRITDPYLDPLEITENCCSETPIRLPNSFWCYDPPAGGPAVSALPSQTSGFITFGCLNNFCKVSAPAVRLWTQVLKAVDRSRLIILCPEGSHRPPFLDLFEREGINTNRIELIAPRSPRDYLELYHHIDVGLDTIPYNGHTTSLDSYWMGVPVVTLVGQTIVGRAGLSQLTNLGLPELIARTPEEYLQIAAGLANALPRLVEMRRTLRPRMETSPLMDAKLFAHNIEAAYRQMWQTWCAESTP